ncbi:MAG TPA: RICIN domain-containing protein [Oscillospiraceae bacterium]|nr:RICIN domain-containing protein [Oscillospiraceae bacterium]
MKKNFKQILAALLVAIMLVGVAPIATVKVSAANHTADEAISWLWTVNGKSLDYDGAYGAQCVDLIAYYYAYLGVTTPGGNANKYSTNALPSGWQRFKGGTPQKGDILVYAGGSGNGHVAIYESETVTWHQNWSGHYVQRLTGKSYKSLKARDGSPYWGCIRPNFNTIVDTSAPTISNPYVSNVSGTQFTINCTLSDDVGISRVWLNIYGPSGSDGFSVAASNGSFSYTIQTDKYGGSGWYSVHLYAFDTSEKQTRYAFEGIHATSYANLGDDFYAYIIKMNSWKHLENSKTGNVQIAANGNDSNDPRQIWHFIRQSDNSYKISNEYNNECMDACNWGTEKGTNVGTMVDSGVTAQRWYIIQSGEGYKIKTSYTDLCLDCSDNSDDPGTNVQLYTNYDTSAQLFSIYHLTKDGVIYSKPSAPSSTNVSVSVNCKNVTASWSSVPTNGLYDKREYDIRVYDGNNTIILEKYNVKSGYSFTLSEKGKYRISVAVVNAKYANYFNMTYSDWFTISEPLKTYAVSYNVNGGTGSIASQTKTHNTNLTLTTNKPTGKSFTVTYNANGGTVSTSSKTVAQTFTNWNTAANGNGTTYNAGATYSANASVTLYAQYANPSIGSLPTPTRSGYNFDGWYTSANGGTKITDSTKVTANTTVYAHWTKNAETKAVVKDVKIEHNATVNYKSTYMLLPEITADKGTKYKVKYESSDTDVATVDENGKVYAAKKGNATITCTVTDSYGNAVTDKCNVNVDYSGAQWFIIIVLFGWIWYI